MGTRNLWALIGKDYYDEIEAVTVLDIRMVRRKIRSFWSMESFPECYEAPEVLPATLYSLRKHTNDKILSVIAVPYIKKLKKAIIYMPWSIVSRKHIMLKGSPLMLTRQGGENTFEVIWPNRICFSRMDFTIESESLLSAFSQPEISA